MIFKYSTYNIYKQIIEEEINQSTGCLTDPAKEGNETTELFSTLSFPELSLAEELGPDTDNMSSYYSHMDMNPFYGLVNIK